MRFDLSSAITAAVIAAAEVLLAICLLFCTTHGQDTFTALTAIEGAHLAQRHVASALRQYVADERERLKAMTRLAWASNQRDPSASSIERTLSDPVSTYLIIKRLHSDSDQIQGMLLVGASRAQELLNSSALSGGFLPSESDVIGAAFALLRLQDTYQLSPAQLADGSFSSAISSYDFPWRLTTDDIIRIGKMAYEEEDYFHALLWLMEAERRLSSADTAEPVDVATSFDRRADVLDYLAYSLHEQGNTRRALELTQELLKIRPSNARYLENAAFYESVLESAPWGGAETGNELKLQRSLYGHQLSDDFVTYEQLCRHRQIENSPMAHHLRCRYVNRGNPLLMYSPAKEEELSREPKVFFFHQVLSDLEIKFIKNMSTPLLHRSGVVSNNSQTAYADYRTSQSAWLDDDSDARLGRIARRLSAIAGLNGRTAEALQVLNYGIGGQYEPHLDHSHESHGEVFLKGAGNRISTFLNYLTDVEAGGSTVFPRLGIAVKPQKGGALMWYNLLRNGHGDDRTLHAACPVLFGYKWVANKWYHEVGNEFTRQCSLDENE